MVKDVDKKLKAFTTAFRDAKLVGCVRGSMILGEASCSLIELCEYAPKKDIPELIGNLTNYDAIHGQDSSELSSGFIEDAWKLLDEAKEISARCPLRVITKMPHPWS